MDSIFTLPPLVLIFVIAFFASKWRRSSINLPPGPRAWPIIGNIFDIPAKYPWKVCVQWARDYNSDIVSLRIPGATLVVLNKLEDIQELFGKRSALYSDRPQPTIFEIMKADRMMSSQNYGERFKCSRKLFKQQFDTAELISYRHTHLLAATRRLLVRLLETEDHKKDIHLASGEAIMSVTYGIVPKDSDDHYFKLVREMTKFIADVISREDFLVDAIPMLKHLPSWFPGATYKTKAAYGTRLLDEVIRQPFEYVKNEMRKGTAVPAVCSHFLDSLDDYNSEEDAMVDEWRNTFGLAFFAGYDPTANAACSFVLAMLLYPDVQTKAQTAIDAALHNTGRLLPTFSDQIPYVDALIAELLRWNPVTPLGAFHRLNTDDFYKGFVIPEGAVIAPNLWAVLHDEEIYGMDVDELRPERFLSESLCGGEIDEKMSTVMDAAFGFGRRSCAGRVFAKEYLWMVITSILSVYDVVDGVDANGEPLDRHKIEYSSDFVSLPPHVRCKFRLRPGVLESMIREAAD
ncbi:cytochrome p450 [Moniliophthora roreri MCA 2997]|uniref:Cytochrome p450 n=2 Tax=Moniliophthora roreri TaxID=221103 RepID=V2WXR4_MONRO|nr:cytochrome p450 [Moniliophthora roreri MCA 2997]KAI3609638.1 cytochrome p450 [Moniliophthora roreri]